MQTAVELSCDLSKVGLPALLQSIILSLQANHVLAQMIPLTLKGLQAPPYALPSEENAIAQRFDSSLGTCKVTQLFRILGTKSLNAYNMYEGNYFQILYTTLNKSRLALNTFIYSIANQGNELF